MTPRWLSSRRNLRAFDRYTRVHGPGWRAWCQIRGIDYDRAWNLARWLARTADPSRAWHTAVGQLTAEKALLARHSCAACARIADRQWVAEQMAAWETEMA